MADDINLVVGVDYRELTGLIKTTKQTEGALKLMAREFAKTGSQKDYMRGINQLVSAQKSLDQSSRMSRSEIMKLGNQMRQEAKFTDALAAATNRLSVQRAKATKIQNSFASAQMAATKSSNRLGVVTQQAGYQVSDFVVQVQSGTNPLVAFSQQAAQLTGVLPLVADNLGMTTRSAIALSAGLGIAIPLISSAAMVLLNMRDSAAKAKKQMDAMEKGFNEISSSLNSFDAAIRDLSQNGLETLRERYGSITEEVLKLQEALIKVEQTATKKSIEKQIETSFTPDFYKQLTQGFTPTQQAVLESLGDPEAMAEEISMLENEISALKASIESRTSQNILVGQEEINLLSDYSNELAALQLDFENAGKLKEELKLDQRIFEGYAKLEKQVKEALDTGQYEEAANRISLIRRLAEEAGIDVSQGAFANLSQLESMLRQFNNQVEQSKKLKIEITDPDEEKRLERLAEKADAFYKKTLEQLNSENAVLAARLQNFGNEKNLKEAMKVLEMQELEAEIKLLGIDGDRARQLKNALLDKQSYLDKLDDEIEKEEKLAKLRTPFSSNVANMTDAQYQYMLDLQSYGAGVSQGRTTTFKTDKDKPKGTTPDPLADLKKQLDLEQALIGKTEARQRVIQALGTDFMKYGKDTINSLEKQINKTIQLEEAERKRQQVLEEARQRQQDVADTIASSMENAMMSMIDGTKSVEAAFKNMASEIIKELYRIYVVKQITGMVSDAVGLFTGAPVGQVSMSANGNAFRNGSIIPYANGGVVGSPTYFPMAGGKTGLMGEAGPEAIMPLKRGKGGKLGVQVEGSTGDTINITQNINVSTGVQQTVRTEIRQLMPQIAESAKAAVVEGKRRGGNYGRSFA